MIERKHPLAECESCPLREAGVAHTKGPQNAKIAIVSRSPGYYDTLADRPFSGPSGKILDYLLTSNDVSRDDILVTNIVLCQCEEVPKEAIRACRARLASEISGVDTVVAAGAEAVREFLGPIAISKARGIEHKTETYNRVVATNNPAAVIYDSDTFPNLVEDFALALNPPPPVKYPQVDIIYEADRAKRFLQRVSQFEGLIGTDLEGHFPHIECAGFSLIGSEATVLPRTTLEQVWDEFKQCYESNRQWLWHNGIYDTKLLRVNGINANIVHDTYPLSYVLDEREARVHGLEYLSRTKLGWTNYEPTSVEHYKDTGELPEDIDELHQYNGYDCAATLQLYDYLRPKAIKDEVWNLYKRYIPRMNALVDVELRGFHYDAMAAADLNERTVLPELRRIVREMQELTGYDLFKPSSRIQVSAFIYDDCGLIHMLKNTKKNKFDRSFRVEVRKEVIDGRFHCKSNYKDKLIKYAKLHQAWSEIDKQRSTYIEALIDKVQPNGKLYCYFNPCGTSTGRLSSSKPNFQNITRTERNIVPAIRTLFKPSPGNVLIQADYSQAELRCIARFSGDSELLNIYRNSNRSLHKETAAAFYGEDYTKDEYVKSKNINFGVPYGQSAFAFAQMYHMPRKEAQDYIDAWFKKFPGVSLWIESVKKEVFDKNVIINPFGRKRRFHLLTEENIEDCYREAVNFLPQSTSTADFTMEALVELNNLDVPIISTVHDSILADVPQEDAMETAILMKTVMERIPITTIGWNDIPFVVDVSISDVSWGDVEEIELPMESVLT